MTTEPVTSTFDEHTNISALSSLIGFSLSLQIMDAPPRVVRQEALIGGVKEETVLRFPRVDVYGVLQGLVADEHQLKFIFFGQSFAVPLGGTYRVEALDITQ